MFTKKKINLFECHERTVTTAFQFSCLRENNNQEIILDLKDGLINISDLEDFCSEILSGLPGDTENKKRVILHQLLCNLIAVLNKEG